MSDAVAGDKNLLFVVLDSLRTDRVSAYNDAVEFTEQLQSIADSSVVFDNAVTQAPWTLPSHASMFTGDYPWDHGTTHARSYFDGSETFLAAFTETGYTTAAITPNVWITPHKGMTDDFDSVENFLTADNSVTQRLSRLSTKLYDGFGTTTKRIVGRQLDRAFRLFGVDDSCKSAETVAAVEEYLTNHSDDTGNFFCYVNLMEPHEPYHPPARYKDKHGVTDESAIPHRQKDMFTKDDIDFEELRRIYDASVDYTDDLVGRIYDTLDETGLSEDTVVVVLSDHGQALGENGAFGHQFTVAESVINTVLMVDHPDLAARRESRLIELRRLHDLIPYYAGIAPEPQDVFSELVVGGCEFPENFTGFIPRAEWDDYYRKHRYAKTADTKVVKSVGEDGEAVYTAYDLDSGTEVPVPADLKRAVDGIGDVDVGDNDVPDETDAEVTRRLEALGYR